MEPSHGGGNLPNVAYARLREPETEMHAERRWRSMGYSETPGITRSMEATLYQ